MCNFDETYDKWLDDVNTYLLDVKEAMFMLAYIKKNFNCVYEEAESAYINQ